MSVSEKQMLLVTQIAYADLDIALEALSKEGQNGVNLGDALKYAIMHENKMWDDYEMYFDISRDNTGKVISANLKDEYSEIAEWSIISAKNDNHPGESGFYACILDTGDERIVGCRGSESMTEVESFVKDWIHADFMLLNSVQTSQEEVLMEYLKENKEMLSEKPWISSGHSLGGALADHAAILSVELDIDNFAGTYNFDGPGHSKEYLAKHKDAITKVSGLMKHFKASIVGNLLWDIPGVEQKFIMTSKESRLQNEDGTPAHTIEGAAELGDFVLRHSTQYWVLDENGETIWRSQDAAEFIAEKISKALDRLPPIIGDRIPEALEVLGVSAFWTFDFLDKHPELRDFIVQGCINYIINHPIETIVTLVDIAVVAVVVVGIVVGVELLIEKIEEWGEKLAQGICDMVDWLKGKTAELFSAIKEVIKDIGNWFNEHFNNGAKYVKEHPYFKADTDRLYHYAARLQRVNNRLISLDRDLRSLYWQVGFLDLWDILCANVLTCESKSLNKAKNYLTDTADRLSFADSKAKGYLEG